MKKQDNNIDALLGQVVALLQHAKLDQAEPILERILQLNPRHADAEHLLGVIAIQRGQHETAIRWIAEAIKHDADVAMYFNNYCLALNHAGRLQEALSAGERAIQLSPDLPEAHYNLANVLRGLECLTPAAGAYERAVRLRPAYAEAHYAKATLLLETGHAGDAEPVFRIVLQLNPRHAGAYNNLAVVLTHAGRLEEALAACDRAIQLAPGYAHAYNSRANVLRKLHRLEDALKACERAIELDPAYADAFYNRGNMLLDAGCVEQAESDYRRALELKPGDAHLHSNLLFLQAARANQTFDEMLESLRQWDELHGQEGRRQRMPERTPSAASRRRLRVGYVSPHLRSHVVSFFFEPLLAAHDRAHFEVFCYASFQESRADKTTERLRKFAEHWRFVGDKNDAELASLIYDDKIDILVDLTGHTAQNRLKAFTYRPAPVQASYLGFFAPTGLAAIDYWITDEVLHPRDTQEESVERILRLPRCWVCYQAPDLTPEVAPCPNNDDKVVFGCFNHLSKLSAEVIKTWSEILLRVPESRLLVMAKSLADPRIRALLLERFATHGVGPKRLILRKGASYREYFSTYAEVDVVLDPFPRTGGTTTAEALWMGVPVVTLAGQRYVERISASKLTALGLEDLITQSPEAYIEKAMSLASDPAKRAELRTSLRTRMAKSPLCDAAELARAMESAYRLMWEGYSSRCAVEIVSAAPTKSVES